MTAGWLKHSRQTRLAAFSVHNIINYFIIPLEIFLRYGMENTDNKLFVETIGKVCFLFHTKETLGIYFTGTKKQLKHC